MIVNLHHEAVKPVTRDMPVIKFVYAAMSEVCAKYNVPFNKGQYFLNTGELGRTLLVDHVRAAYGVDMRYWEWSLDGGTSIGAGWEFAETPEFTKVLLQFS